MRGPLPKRYPSRTAEALTRLLDAVTPLAPEPASLVVYGSLAKGTYREGESDVNLAVVLHDASPASLRAFAGPLREAHRAVKVSPFVIARAEIARLLDVFPVKIADIVAARDVLLGDDPFVDLVVEPEHLRLRVEQELRNHLVRLRRSMVFAGDDPRALGRAIFQSTTSLSLELGGLLRVTGRSAPTSTREIFATAAEAFALDGNLLERLIEIKEGASLRDAEATLSGLLGVLTKAVEVVDRATAPVGRAAGRAEVEPEGNS